MNATILVVDDDPIALQMLEESVRRGGFEVLRAYGAEDALRKVKLRRPDLVLTDLEMPKLNGVELIVKIRKDPEICDTPIIVVTAYAWDTIGQAAAQAGCDGHIAKPFTSEKLLLKVRECLAARAGAVAPRRPPVAADAPPRAMAPSLVRRTAPLPTAVPAASPAGDEGTVFDRATFLEYVDGDVDIAQRAIAVLLETLPDRLEAIRVAVASRDSAALRAAAHSVKGSVAFFAAPVVVAAAYRLEIMGSSGDLGQAGMVYFDLERAIGRLVEALKGYLGEIDSPPVAAKAAESKITPLRVGWSR